MILAMEGLQTTRLLDAAILRGAGRHGVLGYHDFGMVVPLLEASRVDLEFTAIQPFTQVSLHKSVIRPSMTIRDDQANVLDLMWRG